MIGIDLVAGSLLLSTVASGQTASIRVDWTKQGTPISPILYGIFFEEINHAGDGGLYAELVRNRSFEDAPEPQAWVLQDEGGRSRIAIDTSQPLNTNNPQSLRWEIEHGAGPVRLINEGYWGIAVQKDKRYRLSIYARRDERWRGTLTVRIEGANGEVYAQHTVKGISPTWRRFSARLTAKATDSKARLVILTDAPGTVWLDMVSLMPEETFKRRPNGLRADLAQMLADLKPSFVRFPGGCFVEGISMQNALRWRNTLGDIAERPARWCLWG